MQTNDNASKNASACTGRPAMMGSTRIVQGNGHRLVIGPTGMGGTCLLDLLALRMRLGKTIGMTLPAADTPGSIRFNGD